MHQKEITKLTPETILPLTCSRIGTCCHGNQVLINPWELHLIAKEKKITPKQFKDLYCELGGIRLKFNGKKDTRGKSACSQYIDGFGCSLHEGRPLACRLFPIGRQVQNNEVQYIHQGKTFPCLDGCSEVLNLPKLTVGEYLEGQKANGYEAAQDFYLEVMQNLADIAFELLLDSALAESGDTETLRLWRTMSQESPEFLVSRIGVEWLNALIVPEINEEDSVTFVQKHNELLQIKIQEKFGNSKTNQEFNKASVIVMGLTIHLAHGLGANPQSLVELWINTAKSYGAKE